MLWRRKITCTQLDPEIQQVIKEYWTIAAPKYSERLHEELAFEHKHKWQAKILLNAPSRETIDVLDVGTGPGFLSIILSDIGFHVTAIDCSDEMLEKAKSNAKAAGISCAYINMDSHNLIFPDNCFDLVISRNVTWTLYDPVKAYTEWKRVLRPGGRILVFDANYGRYCFDKKLAKQKAHDEEAYRRKYGVSPKTNTISEEYIQKMFLCDKRRPEWDMDAFTTLGMNVYTEINVSKELLSERGLLLNSTTPLFMIVAEIPENRNSDKIISKGGINEK
jgi:ubiquinone/menaquinone biosynthesis C-methylase UbiE